MVVIVEQRRDVPLCAVHFAIAAGVIDELPEERGAAHFLEHMLFKGTPTLPGTTATTTIEEFGGDLNAYTGFDETVLHATVAADGATACVGVIADIVRHAILEHRDFERERLVVFEEMRSYDDDPDTVIEEAVAESVFPEHPYGRPILGSRSDLEQLTPDALRRFFDRCYRPDRTTLVVVGDIEAQALLAEAEQRLGNWQPSPTPRNVPKPTVPPRAGATFLRRAFSATGVEISFRGPPRGHDDETALEVWTAAIGNGASSRLTARLEQDEDLASGVWSDFDARTAAGTLSFGFVPRTGKTAAAITAAVDELRDALQRGVNGAEILRAREMLLADALFAAETYEGCAAELSDLETRGYFSRAGCTDGDTARELRRRDLASVTPAAARAAAERWIALEQACIVALDTQARPAAVEAAGRIAPLSFARDRSAKKLTFDNGSVLWVLPDERPIVAFDAFGLGGSLHDPSDLPGLANAWSRMVVAGAGNLDAIALGDALDDLSATLDGAAGRNSIALRGTVPAHWAVDALDLFGSVLREPQFDREEWERVREDLLEDVRTTGDRPELVAEDALWANLWPGHPWGKPLAGTTKSISRIDPKRLRGWHREMCTAGNIVVAVAGGISVDDAADALRPHLEKLPKGARGVASGPSPLPPVTSAPRLQAGRQQVHIVLGLRGVDERDPAHLALKIAAAAMHGQGGRLFESLRERRGLAYSLWADAWAGRDGGTFAIGLATAPERAGEARRALRQEVEDYARRPLEDAEIARYRRQLVGQAAQALQTTAGRAADAAYGERNGSEWGFDARRRALEAVQTADVHAALEAALRGPMVEVVVEPQP